MTDAVTVSDEKLAERLREAARDIRNDGTPSQVGLTDEECEQVAVRLLALVSELQQRREREGEQAIVSTREMKMSPGTDGEPRSDFFVSIRVGDREVTPHCFRERFKTEYHVALYDWLLNGGVEPELMAFGPGEWPARKPGPDFASPTSPTEVKALREALSKIDLAWTAALNGSPTKVTEITGWTGSLDNYGQIFAWVARSALTEANHGE